MVVLDGSGEPPFRVSCTLVPGFVHAGSGGNTVPGEPPFRVSSSKRGNTGSGFMVYWLHP